MKLVIVALAVAGLSAPSPPNPHGATDVTSVVQAGSPVPILSLPGDNRRFSSYDFRQDEFGDVDWPVAFIFRGNATVSSIKERLCQAPTHAWTYCDAGSLMFLFDRPPPGATPTTVTFVADKGVKRFNQDCSTASFTAHIRLYPLAASSSPGSAGGAAVVGTAHLDFEDHAGCSGRIHGYPEVAEDWLVDAMTSIKGWTVTRGAWRLHNGSRPYVVLRKVAGVEVPHVYGQDGLATDVVIT
jgi:hypothetical protein